MPTVTVPRDYFYLLLGHNYSDEEFSDICFEFGIELDQVTSEKEIVSKQGQSTENKDLTEEIVYKIEVPANRYDLLCLEGLVHALRIFLKKQAPPQYIALNPTKPHYKLIQRKTTKSVRPYVVACVLRDLEFNTRNLKSFMDLQDKLHQNIGRRRTLVSIGTHDLDTIKQPFYYEAKPQKDIKFIALRENKSMDVTELFHYYKTSPNNPLVPYLHITENAPLHPVIVDANGVVCSLPPIINGEHSKITLSTKNVLVEVTATDYTKANIVLNTVIAMFSGYCKQKYTVEAVEVVDEEHNTSKIYPNLKNETFNNVSVDYLNRGIGINMPAQDMVNLLNRMQLASVLDTKTGTLTVTAPITRSDILHPCDIMEDIAIAYGYNNIVKTLPQTSTIGRQQTINKLTDLLRGEIAQCQFNEVLTWALSSHYDNYSSLNRTEKGNECVRVGNPKTADFEIVRTSMLPGLLKALSSNRGLVALPIRLFEVSDISVQTTETDVGAKNIRNIGALYCGITSGFEIIHGLLDRIMLVNNYHCQVYIDQQVAEQKKREAEVTKSKAAKQAEKNKNEKKNKKDKKGNTNKEPEKAEEVVEEEEEEETIKKFEWNPSRVYSIRSGTSPTYLSGRSADVYIGDKLVGTFGILHPKVLQAYDITYPCSALELNAEVFLDAGDKKHVEQPKPQEVKDNHEKKIVH